MTIGEAIRSVRLSAKLSQIDVESKSGIARSYLSRVENDHTLPSIETLDRLATKGLGTKASEILRLWEDGE